MPKTCSNDIFHGCLQSDWSEAKAKFLIGYKRQFLPDNLTVVRFRFIVFSCFSSIASASQHRCYISDDTILLCSNIIFSVIIYFKLVHPFSISLSLKNY